MGSVSLLFIIVHNIARIDGMPTADKISPEPSFRGESV